MSKSGEVPYTWSEIEKQITDAILCQASVLEAFGPYLEGRLVADYLGIDHEVAAGVMVEDMQPEDIRKIDFRRHQFYQFAKVAYDYAYQLGEFDEDQAVEAWHAVDGLLQGFPQTDANGEPSPFCGLNDFPLRRMLETFFARFGLFGTFYDDDYNPSIRELSLLANMTIPAVRTSLSKEGFRLEKSPARTRSNQEDSGFRLNAADAKLWLSRRRGFIPQRTEPDDARTQHSILQALEDRNLPFPGTVRHVLDIRKSGIDAVVESSGIDRSWLCRLLDDEPPPIDVPALRALACALDVPEPDFVAAGVRYALLAEAKNGAEVADNSP